MAIITKDIKLCDIVLNEPTTITVLNRFNIYLGLGDYTVESICNKCNIDINFFTSILNTYINENYFPEELLKSFTLNSIIVYCEKTNNYYQNLLIPNIERHFDALVMRSINGNNNLRLLRNFFDEVKKELLTRIDFDNSVLFPSALSQNNITINTTNLEQNDLIEDKLDDLINMFVIHLKGDCDVNMCHAVLTSITSFQKDIRQNNRIRYRILLPIICSNKQ